MSVEAISWALNLAPVPADRGGQPSSACKFVLVGLANHAGPGGAGAFPSVPRSSATPGCLSGPSVPAWTGCRPSARRAACSECDEVTRMIGFDSDAPWPCPRCKTTGLPEKARHSSLTGGQPGVPAF